MKNDLGDSADGLEEDKEFLADLDKYCEAKQKLFKEDANYRTQELAALTPSRSSTMIRHRKRSPN